MVVVMHNHSDHAHHDHAHGARVDAPTKAIGAALAVTATVFVAELVGGVISGSVALLADAMHMLSDAAGLIIAMAAVLVGKRAATSYATYGYRRVEVLAAMINAATVLAVSVWIAIEALRRLRDPAPIDTGPMMIIAAIGLAANALSAWILYSQQKESINVRGAYLHVLVDMFGSIAVLGAGAIVALTGFTAADPIASLLIAGLIVPRAWKLMAESVGVMLERVPKGFDAEEVEAELRALPGVGDLHDLHLWSLDGVSVIATVHIVAVEGEDRDQLLDRVQAELHRLGAEHATVQIELPEHIEHETVC